MTYALSGLLVTGLSGTADKGGEWRNEGGCAAVTNKRPSVGNTTCVLTDGH